MKTAVSGFTEALEAERPAASAGAASALYDWLVGSWDMEVVDYGADGSQRRSRGEWHFSWVLEGRAIQDVFIVPGRSERTLADAATTGNRYGTTVRVYDPRTGSWRLTWINPVTHAEIRLTGRRAGARIVQEGCYDDGSPIRWTFSDITPNSFTWRGEVSIDGGQSWRLEAKFSGRRVSAANTQA